MPTQLQLRRGNTAQTSVFTGATAEITVDTDKKVVVVHDGSTAGGVPLAKESVLTAAFIQANAAFEKANATAQQAFTTVSANGVSVVADANTDTLSITSANGVALYANSTTDTLLINLALSGVTSGIYGGSLDGITRVPVITVNDYGITTSLSNTTIDTNSVPETTTNLYFTAARVRANVTNTAPINYDSTTGTFSHAISGVSASGYGDSISIPVFVVTDKGHISSVTNTTIRSTSTSQTGVVQLTDSISSTSTTTAATPNSVKTAYDLAATKFNSSGGTISGDTIVTGNLIVNGETTTVNTSTVSTSDSLLKLANNNIAADSLDIGFYGTYNATGQKYAGLIRQAGSNFFLFKDLTTDPTSNTLAVGSLTASNTATLRANITGGTVSSLASAIAVADGGTGVTTSTGTGSVTLNTSPTLSNVSVTSVNVTNTTTSTSTTTGALTVAGGVGVSGNLYASFVYTQGQSAATIGDALALAIALG
jgi:hypothetical protein